MDKHERTRDFNGTEITPNDIEGRCDRAATVIMEMLPEVSFGKDGIPVDIYLEHFYDAVRAEAETHKDWVPKIKRFMETHVLKLAKTNPKIFGKRLHAGINNAEHSGIIADVETTQWYAAHKLLGNVWKNKPYIDLPDKPPIKNPYLQAGNKKRKPPAPPKPVR